MLVTDIDSVLEEVKVVSFGHRFEHFCNIAYFNFNLDLALI